MFRTLSAFGPFRWRARRGLMAGALACALVVAILGGVWAQGGAPASQSSVTPLRFPDVPWFVGDGVAPNLLLTFDDSDSMKYANAIAVMGIGNGLLEAWDSANSRWVDAPGGDDMSATSGAHAIAYKSDLNSLYFNPRLQYLPPRKADGSSFPDASFTAAPQFGFWPDLLPKVNLENDYRPVFLLIPYSQAVHLGLHCLKSEARRVGNGNGSQLKCPGTEAVFDESVITVNTGVMRWKANQEPVAWINPGAIATKIPGVKGYWWEYVEDAPDAASPRCPAVEPTTDRHLYSDSCWYTPTTNVPPTCPPNPTLTDREGLPLSCRTYRPDPSPRCPARSTITDLSTVSAACFVFRQVSTPAEKQNFANWYAYYRSRNMTAASIAMRFMDGVPADWRVAWQGMNGCQNFGLDPAIPACAGFGRTRYQLDRNLVPEIDVDRMADNTLAPFNAAKREQMWRYLIRFPAGGATPTQSSMINAGEFVARKDAAGNPTSALFADDPTLPEANRTYETAACRRTYHILITDGVPSSHGPRVTPDDGTAVTLPDGARYSGTADARPYYMAQSLSVADIAFKYWAQDLQPNVSNSIPRFMPVDTGNPTADYWDVRNNPATWQHLTSFIITFGLRSYFVNGDWSGSGTHGGLLAKIQAGTATWPDGFALSTPFEWVRAAVADQWHAAINSRGDFFSAESPQDILDSLESIKRRIAQAEAGASAASTSSLSTQSDSRLFSTSFSSKLWDGTLRTYTLSQTGTPVFSWSTDTTFPLPDSGPGSHVVYIKDQTTGTLARLSPPSDQTLTAPLSSTQIQSLNAQATALQTALPGSTVTGASLLRWFFGDRSNPRLRARRLLLGDMVSPSPQFEGGRDYGYATVSWGENSTAIASAYATYQAAKFNNGEVRNPTVFVGANDGMLHAFDAKTGAHRWAYLPTPSIARIVDRANPDNRHVWSMDGPIVTHDVYDSATSTWKTILVASPGIGAKGLFALDITDVTQPKLLWEWFPTDNDVGFITGEPVIARAASGDWLVATGNGYNSTNNASKLILLNALTGSEVKRFTTLTAGVTTPNGMSAPALLYLPGKRLKFAYAGDLQGNVWRFDLGSATVADWKVSMAGKPLATVTDGTDRQPITAKIRIASDRQQGRMLLFGTGRLLDRDDPALTTTQTLYGIWDQADTGSAYTTLRRSNLQPRTLVQASSGSTTRTVTGDAIATGKQGWYLDLSGSNVASGERVVAPVNYLPEASLMVASTIRPITSAPACGSKLESWQLLLSPFEGTGINVLQTDGGDRVAGVRRDGMVAPSSPLRDRSGKASLVLNLGLSGVDTVKLERNSNARVGWVQPR